MLDVERWAELRREHFVRGVGVRELAKRTGLARNTVRRALRAEGAPAFRCPPRLSKLDPFKEEVHRLLARDARLPAVRVRELIEELAITGGQTIVDEYVRELRPLFAPRRTFQRTVYRPGEICQFDLWQPREEIPVGHGQTRQGWVVVACLGYSRAGAGALVFSKQAPDLLWASRAACGSLGGAARDARLGSRGRASRAAAGARATPSPPLRPPARRLALLRSPPTRRPRGSSSACRATSRPTSSPGGASPTTSTSSCSSTRGLEKANARTHRTLSGRPADRLAEERALMRPLPERMPDDDHAA